MKKLLAFLLAIPLLLFAGCAATMSPEETEPPVQTQPSPQPEPPEEIVDGTEPEEITKMYFTINGNKLEVALAENPSVDALVELLKKGDVTYEADDYGGFEKVGSLGRTLPENNERITTETGDVMLYLGNQICIFVGSNTWSYTRIGKINGYTASELRTLLGAGKGKVQITISLK